MYQVNCSIVCLSTYDEFMAYVSCASCCRTSTSSGKQYSLYRPHCTCLALLSTYYVDPDRCSLGRWNLAGQYRRLKTHRKHYFRTDRTDRIHWSLTHHRRLSRLHFTVANIRLKSILAIHCDGPTNTNQQNQVPITYYLLEEWPFPPWQTMWTRSTGSQVTSPPVQERRTTQATSVAAPTTIESITNLDSEIENLPTEIKKVRVVLQEGQQNAKKQSIDLGLRTVLRFTSPFLSPQYKTV
jgi:hypothetical protein